MDQDSTRLLDRTTRLLSLASALGDVNTTDEVAEVVLNFGLGIVEAARGFFACVAEERLRVVAARGYPDDIRRRVMSVDERSQASVADAVRTGQLVWLENVGEYIARYPWAFREFGAVGGTQAHAAVPLIHRGSVIGCIAFSFCTATSFGAADRTFMLLLGQVVAGALQRARSHDDELQRRERAENAAAARAEILGVVAHDLRNPLSLIDLTAQFLLEVDPPVERRREMLAAARRATARMHRLIADLLDAVRMQSGRVRLDVREVEIGAILRAADDGYRALAEQRGIQLVVAPNEQPLSLQCDEARVVQAIGNLVGNALKFTRTGGRVSLSVAPADRGVTFRVTDTGAGIAPSETARVFDRFWQARHGDHTGTGLGLAIVKGIVEAHGGRVWVQSTLGVGTTFAFTIPRSIPSTAWSERGDGTGAVAPVPPSAAAA
jgi:signal transduction histidine kinase